MSTAIAGFNGVDLIYNVHACRDTTEDSVAYAVLRLGLVKKSVIGRIDKELAGRTVRNVGSRHSDRVLFILQSIPRLILDWGPCFLRAHIGSHASALNHKTLDDSMKNGSVVMTILGILQEVCRRNRSLLGVEFDRNVAKCRLNRDQDLLSGGVKSLNKKVEWSWE